MPAHWLRRAAIHGRRPQAVLQQPARGFTLIELLVAVVIVAVLVTALVMNRPGLEARRVDREAERLALVLALACEQAELSGRPLGLHLGRDGYGFSLATSDGWLPYAEGREFGPRRLEGVVLSLSGAERLPELPEFTAEPIATCWPDGTLSALDVRIAAVGDARAAAVRVRSAADAAAVVEVSDDGRRWRARA